MARFCNPYPYHKVSVSCIFSPVIDTDTNSNTMFQKIIKIVSKYCEVSISELTSKSRKTELAEARHLAIYFIYNHVPKATSARLGRYFDRKHSTILNSIKCVENFKDVDPAFKSQFEFLEREVLKAITN